MKRRLPVVCLAFSGGLDTTYCALLLREEGNAVHAVTVDTGGFSPAEKKTIAARARAARVARHVVIDGRSEVFERYALPLIFGNILRGGVYPLSVAAERAVQAEAVARYSRRAGAVVCPHRSTTAGT
jgi:argininosuccinate synthase